MVALVASVPWRNGVEGKDIVLPEIEVAVMKIPLFEREQGDF